MNSERPFKRHGLWLDINRRNCFHSYWSKPSPRDIVRQCALKAMCIYRLPATVGVYNQLCRRISERSGYDHHLTLRSVLLDQFANGARLKIKRHKRSNCHLHDGSLTVEPIAGKWLHREVKNRLDSIRRVSMERYYDNDGDRNHECNLHQWDRTANMHLEMMDTEQSVRDINRAIKAASAAIERAS